MVTLESESAIKLRRLQAKTKVMTDIIRDFLFADAFSLNTGSAADMQHSVDKFSTTCTNLRLTISTKTTASACPRETVH